MLAFIHRTSIPSVFMNNTLRSYLFRSLLASAVLALLSLPTTADTQRTDTSSGYALKLADIDQQIQNNSKVADIQTKSWLRKETLARSYLARAKLTGNFSDYVLAKETLDSAFAQARPHSGPKLARASLNFAIHRLPLVEADLAHAETALLVSKKDRQTIKETRADVWLNTGQYAQALEAFERFESKTPSVTSATRQANYYRQTADYSAAEQWLNTATQRSDSRNPHLRSWLQLQHGILDLDRGRFDDALAHYKQGLEEFSGYWLIEEHIAEIHALQGNDKLAETQYRDLIERTDSPLFMTALAEILANRDDKASQTEAQSWLDKSAEIYQYRLQAIPELVAGHALDFFLNDENAQFSLQLATDNYKLRPGGEAALQLVQAHALNNQFEQANTLLETLYDSPYRNASLYATAATVYRAMGQNELAETQKALANAINPFAMEDIDWMRAKLKGAQTGL